MSELTDKIESEIRRLFVPDCTCGKVQYGEKFPHSVAAAIEQAVRAQIAADIRREMHNLGRVMPGAVAYVTAYDDGLTAAARIAEGERRVMCAPNPRPVFCCGVCPEKVSGGFDCTCWDNPRCNGPSCPNCGHPALDHHGVSTGVRRDSGCQTRVMRDDWCRCPHTATGAATLKAGSPFDGSAD